jgi:hypothetical protein
VATLKTQYFAFYAFSKKKKKTVDIYTLILSPDNNIIHYKQFYTLGKESALYFQSY